MFAENAFNITPRWLLVGGGRQDWIRLDRTILPTTVIDRDYDAFSWRVRTVYDLFPKTQLFAQYANAIVPVGNFLLIRRRKLMKPISSSTGGSRQGT